MLPTCQCSSSTHSTVTWLQIIKGEVQKTELPKLEDYKIAAEQRVRTHDEANNKRARGPLKYMTKLA